MGTLSELAHLAAAPAAGRDDEAVRREALAQRLAPWRTRRSVAPRRLQGPAPDALQLQALLAAAANAPDHGRLRPCRLVVLDDAARLRLARAFQDYRRRALGDLSAEEAARESDRALNGPCLVAVAARVRDDLPDVPLHEQWIAVGAVIGNLMAAANALGFAGKVLSGARVGDEGVRAAAGCAGDEQLVAFAHLGTAGAEAHAPRSPSAEDKQARR